VFISKSEIQEDVSISALDSFPSCNSCAAGLVCHQCAPCDGVSRFICIGGNGNRDWGERYLCPKCCPTCPNGCGQNQTCNCGQCVKLCPPCQSCKTGTICSCGTCIEIEAPPQICTFETVNPVNCTSSDNVCCGCGCSGVCIPRASCQEKCTTTRNCTGGSNADLCAKVKCEAGTTCFEGDCIPNNFDKCAGIKCNSTTRCFLGSCIANTSCTGIACTPDKHCLLGKCEVTPTCAKVNCSATTICVSGHCIDKCLTMRCNVGFKCTLGQCVANPCHNVTCQDVNYICSQTNGKCIPRTPCGVDKKCPVPETCYNGVACGRVDPCAHVICPANSRCVNGVCLKL